MTIPVKIWMAKVNVGFSFNGMRRPMRERVSNPCSAIAPRNPWFRPSD
jgi:hypothetical protein